jgi:uncharacterized membrane protein
MDPAQAFAWVALPAGVLLVILTPPFQAPDEPNHFARAFQVSDGHLVSERTSDSVGGRLPRSLHQLTGMVMGRVPFNPEVEQDLGAWHRAFEIPLLPDDRIEIAFPNTALSGPVAYVPQALGIEFGRILGASALTVFYWGRLSNLLLCVAITALAIRWLTIRRWTCVLLSLLPMTMFLRSSVSSDGPTLALTILALAICLRPIDLPASDRHVVSQGIRRVNRIQRWLPSSVAALLALGKPPYGAAALLAIATPPTLIGGTKRYISMVVALLAVLFVAQGGWALAMRGKTAVMAPGAAPQTQIATIIDHPADTAVFLASDLVRSAPALAHQAVGVLGWLDAPLPGLVAIVLGLIIVLVALGEPGPPLACTGFRWLGAGIFVAGVFTLHAMNYVWWTPPGSPRVEGIQGRHFLPLLPFLFATIGAPIWLARPLARVRPVLVAAFLVTSVTATLLTVLDRYYLDG